MSNPTFDQLRDAATLFDRAGLMPRPERIHPGPGVRTLRQRLVQAAIHPQLPPTPFWSYEGMVPGPVVVVPGGSRTVLRHENLIDSTMPYRHVVVDEAAGGSMNDAGSDGASTAQMDVDEAMHVSGLRAHTVVHLHGAPTEPDSDGWADNVSATGESRLAEYEFGRETWPMDTPAGSVTYRGGAGPTFWYHDHGMSVTRFNVYAGLAGMWLVRDPLEQALGLPTDRRYEIPLVIMDRNLDTDDGTATGRLDGRMLHKVQVGVRECFAPVNLVNGLAWPRIEVRRRVHRLRLLNGSNARTFRLNLMGTHGTDEGTRSILPDAAVQQIGTDGGLLGQAIPVPPGGLILAPGERADVLVDFGLVADAGFDRVVVYNSAPAPFQGQPLTDPASIHTPDPDGFRVTPQVMRFDLVPSATVCGLNGGPIAGMPLDPEFVRVPATHQGLPADHGHTIVALREEDCLLRDDMGAPMIGPDGKPMTETMLFVHELAHKSEADAMGCDMHEMTIEGVDDAGNLANVCAGVSIQLPGTSDPLVTVGKRFMDSSMAAVAQGSWHMFKVINLSPDTHPFHVHLTQFQAMSRHRLTLADPGTPVPKPSTEFVFVGEEDVGLDANELGWKDTFRVNPGTRDPNDGIVDAELFTIIGCFSQHAGQYVYHCHILEHEDSEMMRPFVVVPPDVMALTGRMRH